MNILVVDDDQDTVALLTMLLERQGWCVGTATSVEEARAALVDSEYGVLVADLHLPDGNGLSLAGVGKKLRGAILVTGGEDYEQRRASFGLGWNRCLTKPVAGAEVVATIRQLLDPNTTRP
ncbi:MAG TPA: response regulator [Polyangiales bacterium]|jgi:DNA-binding response OmpR family regulator|nr:response regulator [Polyangiales bacterium]